MVPLCERKNESRLPKDASQPANKKKITFSDYHPSPRRSKLKEGTSEARLPKLSGMGSLSRHSKSVARKEGAKEKVNPLHRGMP